MTTGLDPLISPAGPYAWASFFGVDLIPQPHMADWKQWRTPRSGKARIRKKWREVQSNWRMEPWTSYVAIGNRVYAHPKTIEKICTMLKARSPR